jgi:hypothetical protein
VRLTWRAGCQPALGRFAKLATWRPSQPCRADIHGYWTTVAAQRTFEIECVSMQFLGPLLR